MNILLIIAAVLFFLSAVGSQVIPNETAWGFFFMALGLALGGIVNINFWNKQ